MYCVCNKTFIIIINVGPADMTTVFNQEEAATSFML